MSSWKVMSTSVHAMIQYLCDANKMNPQLELIGDKWQHHHEEADVKLLPQKNHIQILDIDIDIIVLLVFFFWVYKPAAQVSMKNMMER